MLTLTTQEVRRVDQLAVDKWGVPSIVLMENAARGAAQELLTLLKRDVGLAADQVRIAIVCGGGNNGGDGLAMARHLHNAGAQVNIDLTRPDEDFKADAATNLHIVKQMKLPIHALTDPGQLPAAVDRWRECHVIVDAMLGTGFFGQVRQPLASVIAAINDLRAHSAVVVMAVDVPSGLDADTGQVGGVAIAADLTVTFVTAKPGLLTAGAKTHVGQLIVCDIGVGSDLIDAARHKADQ